MSAIPQTRAGILAAVAIAALMAGGALGSGVVPGAEPARAELLRLQGRTLRAVE